MRRRAVGAAMPQEMNFCEAKRMTDCNIRVLRLCLRRVTFRIDGKSPKGDRGLRPPGPVGLSGTLRFYWSSPSSGDSSAAGLATPPAAEEILAFLGGHIGPPLLRKIWDNAPFVGSADLSENSTRRNLRGAEQAPRRSSVLSGKRRGAH